jgi:hypothetical protein
MASISLGNSSEKGYKKNQQNTRICVAKEAWLNRHDFDWIEQNLSHLSCIAAQLNFSLETQEGLITMHAVRAEYSVEICFWADDNLTGFPKVTVDIFTDNAFLPLLEDVASRELACLIRTLFSPAPVQKPISENEASKTWPQPEVNGR